MNPSILHECYENGQLIRAVDFPFDEVDRALGVEPPEESDDDRFWKMQGEIFEELLRWLTEPKAGDGVGARLHALTMFLCPWLIDAASHVPDQSTQDELSKALLQIEKRFPASPEYYRKLAELRPKLQEIRERAKRGWQSGRRRSNAACQRIESEHALNRSSRA